jgi:hypothetical protein
MFAYIPSLITAVLGLAIAGAIYGIKPPLLILAVTIILVLFIVINQNLSYFSTDYYIMSTAGSLSYAAPYLIVGAVILFSLLYIFMLRGSSVKTTTNTNSTNKNVSNMMAFPPNTYKKSESNNSAKSLGKVSSGQASSILEKIV